jgi:hypothetical protein
MTEWTEADLAHMRKVPLISSTDPVHLPETIERLQMENEILARKIGIDPKELTALAIKEVAERKEAEYREIFASYRQERELVEKNLEWSLDVIPDIIRKEVYVVRGTGGIAKWDDLECQEGRKLDAVRFARAICRNTQHESKEAVREMWLGELTHGRYSYTTAYCDREDCLGGRETSAS